MPITTYSLDQLEAAVLAFFGTRFPGRDLGTESWLGKQARAIAMALLSIEKAIEDADHDATPSPKSSTGALDLFAVLFGLPSNQGGFGRNGSTAASGGVGPVTGTNGTIYPDGSLLLASDGVTQFALSGAVTIRGLPPGSGSATGKFVAITKGTAGNLPSGSVLTWVSPPSGSDAVVVLSSGLGGGLDVETDSALLQRIYDRLQKPPKGGAAHDYRSWAESVPGVFRAYVYPLRGGMNTVHVVLTSAGTGRGRVPSAAVKLAVDSYIKSQRPVTVEGYQSLLPATAAPIAIRIRVIPSPQYRFDWSSAGPSFTVGSYAPPSGSTPPALVLNPAPPDDLVGAVALGQQPRLQIRPSGSTNSPALLQARVVAVSGATLTLDNPLPLGAVNTGDPVFSGGPLVDPVTQVVLQYVDALGPSRQSGYADPDDPWEDVAAVARITQIVLDLRDAFGIPLARNLVAGGLTVDGGGADRQARDLAATSPEILIAGSIAVTD